MILRKGHERLLLCCWIRLVRGLPPICLCSWSESSGRHINSGAMESTAMSHKEIEMYRSAQPSEHGRPTLAKAYASQSAQDVRCSYYEFIVQLARRHL